MDTASLYRKEQNLLVFHQWCNHTKWHGPTYLNRWAQGTHCQYSQYWWTLVFIFFSSSVSHPLERVQSNLPSPLEQLQFWTCTPITEILILMKTTIMNEANTAVLQRELLSSTLSNLVWYMRHLLSLWHFNCWLEPASVYKGLSRSHLRVGWFQDR